MTRGPLLVQTTNGPVLGYADTHYFSDVSALAVLAGRDGGYASVAKWLGIPYAQAERWRRCVPPEPWTQPRQCYDYGPGFPAPPDINSHILYGAHGVPYRRDRLGSDEQRGLTVNVHAPGDVKPGEKLPVLAWVHGGGLAFGISGDMSYDPTQMIRKQAAKGRRVIVVSANYRLNMLGLLVGQDMVDEANGAAVGNWGLHDNAAWLQWVQDNIAAFGGDPDNVTAYGESAGSITVSHLLVHPSRLFTRAILQSGGPNSVPAETFEQADKHYQDLIDYHGLRNLSGPERLAALREMPYETLAKAYAVLPQLGPSSVAEFGRDAIFTDHPIKMIRRGVRSSIEAVMLGLCGNEGAIFPHTVSFFTDNPHEMFLSHFPPDMASTLRQHYINRPAPIPAGKEEWVEVDAADFCGNCIVYGPVEELLDALLESQRCTNVPRAPLQMYRIDATVDKVDKKYGLGACHSISLAFMFDTDILWDQEDCIESWTASNLTDILTSFAQGSEGPKSKPWQSIAEGKLWRLSRDGHQELVDRGLDGDRDMWKRVYTEMTDRISKAIPHREV